MPQPPTPQQRQQQQQKAGKSKMDNFFERYNLIETSYHLYTGRIDLHLCDDTAPGE